MEQLNLGLSDASPPAPSMEAGSPERRIDITLGTLADIHDAMTGDEKAQLNGKTWWNTIIIVFRLRAMERGEEIALGQPRRGLADAYDRVVRPGDHAADAILKTFAAWYRGSDRPTPSPNDGETDAEG